MMGLNLPAQWLDKPVCTLLFGAGGTGSHLFSALMALDHSLRALDHAGGIHVTVYDPDTVSHHNIGRQAFWPVDVGHNKAVTLVQRANLAMGLDWVVVPKTFHVKPDRFNSFDQIITAVDRAKVRAEIGQTAQRLIYSTDQQILWLDCGNSDAQAQIVLGHWQQGRAGQWIPNVYQLYPELADIDDSAQHAPSCSAAESLSRQWLPINRMVADTAQNLLWMLFRQGRVGAHGAFIDLRLLSIQPLRCDPHVWSGFGYCAEAA